MISKRNVSCTQRNHRNLLVIDFLDSFLYFHHIHNQLVYIHTKIGPKGYFLLICTHFPITAYFDHGNHILDSFLGKRFLNLLKSKYVLTMINFFCVNLRCKNIMMAFVKKALFCSSCNVTQFLTMFQAILWLEKHTWKCT